MNKKLCSLFSLVALCCLGGHSLFAQASGVKPELIMYRHNGGGITPAPVVANNILGTLKWNGLVGVGNIVTGAAIRSTVDQVGGGIMSADLTFHTNAGAGLTEHMIITSSGLVGIGTHTPDYHLHVVGNTHTSGRFFGRIHYDVNMPTDLPGSYTDEAYFERKSRAQLGLAANAYANGGILSLAPGGGALDRQIFTGGDDGIWTRSQDLLGGNSWAAWHKLLTSEDINGRPNLVARYLPPGPTSSKLGDGQVFDNGVNVVIGGIAAAPAVPAPTFEMANVFTVNGDSRFNGQISIGKATSAFDLDVNGESNFDGRMKIGAPDFPTDAAFDLAVGGGIMAEEVFVQLQPWPDYVFEKGYELKPLAEVEAFIQQEKHLPGVAPAAEIESKGLNLGEMQKTQMEKIEEIYLHLIALEKRVQQLEAENAALKAAKK